MRALLALWAVAAPLLLFQGSCLAHTGPAPLSLFRAENVRAAAGGGGGREGEGGQDNGVELHVSPQTLSKSGEWVEVSWSGVTDPSEDDVIAAYSPGGSILEEWTVYQHELQLEKQSKLEVEQEVEQVIPSGSGGSSSSSNAIDPQTLLRQTSPIKFKTCADADSGHVSTGAGTTRFRLLNLKDPSGYAFVLYRGGLDSPSLVVVSPDAVLFDPLMEVTNVHLALTSGGPSEMRLSWATAFDDTYRPKVEWWLYEAEEEEEEEEEGGNNAVHGDHRSASSSKRSSTAVYSSTYEKDELCGAPATTIGYHSPGLLHTVVLDGLEPGKRYGYSIGTVEQQQQLAGKTTTSTSISRSTRSSSGRSSSGGPSSSSSSSSSSSLDWKGHFSAAPAPLSAVKLSVFGDMGTSEVDGSLNSGHPMEPAALRTTRLLKEQAEQQQGKGVWKGEMGAEFGLVMHIGDISYARGYDSQWDEFLNQIEPVASRVPWMVALGNHEFDYKYADVDAARQGLEQKQQLAIQQQREEKEERGGGDTKEAVLRLEREIAAEHVHQHSQLGTFYHGEDSGGECGVPYFHRFPMQQVAKPKRQKQDIDPWYSLDYGVIHFCVISTEHDTRPGSPQHDFVSLDLAAVDRAATPWLVFLGHRPMHVDSIGPGADECDDDDDDAAADDPHCANDQPVSRHLRDNLEALLVDNGVDLAMWGHHHSYQRSCPLVGKGECAQAGEAAPVHVVAGMAGMELSRNLNPERPSWVRFLKDDSYGLTFMEANATALHLVFVLEGDVLEDELWLQRPASEQQVHHPPSEFAAGARGGGGGGGGGSGGGSFVSGFVALLLAVVVAVSAAATVVVVVGRGKGGQGRSRQGGEEDDGPQRKRQQRSQQQQQQQQSYGHSRVTTGSSWTTALDLDMSASIRRTLLSPGRSKATGYGGTHQEAESFFA